MLSGAYAAPSLAGPLLPPSVPRAAAAWAPSHCQLSQGNCFQKRPRLHLGEEDMDTSSARGARASSSPPRILTRTAVLCSWPDLVGRSITCCWRESVCTQWQGPESSVSFFFCPNCLWTCRTFLVLVTSRLDFFPPFWCDYPISTLWPSLWCWPFYLFIFFCFGSGKELYHVKVTILEISGNKFSGAWMVKTLHSVTQCVNVDFYEGNGLFL